MKLRKTILALCIAPVISVTAVRAQDQKQDPQQQQTDPSAPMQPLNSDMGGGYSKPPIGAARGVTNPNEPEPYDPSQVLPDENTLAGAELFGVGNLQHTHNIFDPAVSFSELGQTGQNETGTVVPGQQSLSSVTLLGGSFSFNRTWDIFHVTAVYNGGETLNEGALSSHYQFHNLTYSETADWGRWHIILRDNFSAGIGASFTGSGMGGPGLVAQYSSLLGASLNSVSQSFVPTETIETGIAMRYADSVVGQVQYSFSRRASVTFAGSYGLLYFNSPGYISSSMLTGQAGYDYLLDPSDSIAILGSYGQIDYIGTPDSTSNYMAALAFGRKITGHLAFQVGSGPQHIESINSGNGPGDFQLWFLAANSSLTYSRRRGSVSLSFMRGLTAGSGVFLGSKTNTISGSARYQFTRFWLGTVSGGYSMNNSLTPAGTTSVQFDNWFIGANLGRSVGRRAQVNFSYGLERQNNPSSCPVLSCGVTGFQQTFGMTVNWHLRPSGL